MPSKDAAPSESRRSRLDKNTFTSELGGILLYHKDELDLGCPPGEPNVTITVMSFVAKLQIMKTPSVRSR